MPLLSKREFQAWWFETATPTFLVETLVERGVPTPALEGLLATGELLSTFDVGDIAPEALLFQTGYLTMLDRKYCGGQWFYRLGYPNREVRQSLNTRLVGYLLQDRSRQARSSLLLLDLLRSADLLGVERLFKALFASIPYEWHRRNEIARYEGYYASVFYSSFAALWLEVAVEDSSSHGRLDMAVRAGSQMYLFEGKVLERAGAGSAMMQLRERGFADKYRHLGSPVHLVGVEFSTEARNVARFESALA